MFQILRQGMDLVTDTPIHRLHLSTGLQIHYTMREQIKHFLSDLLSIVPVLKDITG